MTSIRSFSCINKSLLIISLILLSFNLSMAEIRVPKLVGDHMVLQRDLQLPIWGWAEPGELVSILFRDQRLSTKADANGNWSITLAPTEAGGPFDMVISGKNTIRLKDIMVGDVWVCSGQSNMAWKLGSLKEQYPTEISNSTNQNIRQVEVERITSEVPLTEIKSSGWKTANPEMVLDFTAIGYFFAKQLNERYDIPIGLIYTTWGGTVAEAWISTDALIQFPEFKEELEKRDSETGRIAMEKYEKDLQAWNESLEKSIKSSKKAEKEFVNLKFDEKGWDTMTLPNLWENAGLKDLDGIVWFRKTIEVPKKWAGKDIIISLGTIDDADSTLFNGKFIGSTAQYNQPREYTVPGSLVKAGKNIIAVKVTDTGGGGGIYGQKENMAMKSGNEELPLHGDWKYKVAVNFSEKPKDPNNPNKPAVLYNGMIAPVIPFAIKGVIWYQGESNTGKPKQYETLFPALIQDWRNKWGQGEFPFLFVQLANFMQPKDEPSQSNWAELRDAQLKTLSLPKTGMAVIIDIGEADDIHPKNKLDVGKRLALSARKIAYNEDIVHSGPIYDSMKKEENAIRIKFKHTGSGLEIKGGDRLQEFSIAGPDNKFYRASARIENDEVIVSSDKVQDPVAVRYAWADNPEQANLYNKEGLPASPFRTSEGE